MKKSIQSAVLVALGLFLMLVTCRLLDSHFTERGRAWRAVHNVGDAVIGFRNKEGRWPKSLNELGRSELLQHRGVAFTYDAVTQKVELPMMFGPTVLERAFSNKGGEGNYGMDLATVWSAKKSQ